MTWTLIAALAGFALADSLNPFTVAAQVYLLGTPKPLARSLTFLGATFAVYFVGGFLLRESWVAFFRFVAPLIPWWGIGTGEIVLGIVLGVAAVWAWRKAKEGAPFQPPDHMSIGATIVFAVASTASDLSSALPYFAAVNQLAQGNLGLLGQLALLGLYNLVYVAPLIILVAAKLMLSEGQSAALFGRARGVIDWAFAKLMLPLTMVASVALLVDGVRRLVGFSF